jgi:thiosulfate reductase cytochrome b subunit
MAEAATKIKVHPLYVRLFHWINAVTMIFMIMSGWEIYNASPLFEGFVFPDYLTLGGWLGGGLLFHFAVMWVFAINLLTYVFTSILTGHYRRSFLPITPISVLRDLGQALRGRLAHTIGIYNSIQKIFYIGVTVLMLLVLVSGLAIWKSVQFQQIATLLGGYEGARLVHFICMALICAFIVVHLLLVLIVPSTLLPMITGWARMPVRPNKEVDHAT